MEPDIIMPDASDGSDPADLLMSSTENRVLELYDQLRKLQLQIALIKAQQAYDGESQVKYPGFVD